MISEKTLKELREYLLPFQVAWVMDGAPLRIMEKSRQVGATFVDALDSVMKAGRRDARLDVWVSSRDEQQARLYLEDCARWAQVLRRKVTMSADAVEFRNGRRIYSVSSAPDALAGKRGHVKLDEFALHQDQRMLYQVAEPVTTWGGQLSVISTHRGAGTVFNEIVRSVREGRDSMGWSLHSVPLMRAVEEGLVEKVVGKSETRNPKENQNPNLREGWVARVRRECIDEEQWLQEYCCVPADESSAFITFEMITGCEDGELRLMELGELGAWIAGGGIANSRWGIKNCKLEIGNFKLGEELAGSQSQIVNSRSQIAKGESLYVGVDVGRKHDLCVIDVGERVGDVIWDRVRLEFQNRSFSEIESELFLLLKLPQVKRMCIDATGMGMQLAERAEDRFAWKVQPITFTAPVKEELAFGLRSDFQERKLRIVSDDKLRSDLRGIKKEVGLSGNIRFLGESKDGHCDRFWALALRQYAARYRSEVGAAVG